MRKFSTSAAQLAERQRNSAVKTRFPTKFNPSRSAFNQQIYTPGGVSYNPAPSAPTPKETPAAFLPKEELELRAWAKDAKPVDVSTMPALSASPARTYHLTKQDAEQIQQLRQSEPYKWTRKALAEKFGVSEYVIGLVSNPNGEHQQDMQSRLSLIQAQWTERRERARDHRLRRKNFWLRDA